MNRNYILDRLCRFTRKYRVLEYKMCARVEYSYFGYQWTVIQEPAAYLSRYSIDKSFDDYYHAVAYIIKAKKEDVAEYYRFKNPTQVSKPEPYPKITRVD